MILFFLKFSIIFLSIFTSVAHTHPIAENNPDLYVERMQTWIDTYLHEGKAISKHPGTSGQEIEIAYAQVAHVESDIQKKQQRKCVFIIQGFMENYLGYARLMKTLFEQGYDVVTFDHRSQGHSSRTIPDEQKIHIEDFQHYIDDVKMVYQSTLENIYDTIYVYSHSMGGLILQEFLRQEPNLPVKKIAMTAPFFGIEDRVAQTISTCMRKLGIGIAGCLVGEYPLTFRKLHSLGYDIHTHNNWFTRLLQYQLDNYLSHINFDAHAFCPMQGPFRPYSFNEPFIQNLTSSLTQYQWLNSIYSERSSLCVGGGTNAWLRAVSKAQRLMKKNKKTFQGPTLIVKAQQDRIVSNPEIDSYVKRMYKKHKQNSDVIKVIEVNARHAIHLEDKEIFYKFIPEVINFFT